MPILRGEGCDLCRIILRIQRLDQIIVGLDVRFFLIDLNDVVGNGLVVGLDVLVVLGIFSLKIPLRRLVAGARGLQALETLRRQRVGAG